MEHIVEQCNLELLLYMHFFIRHLFPCFHRKVNFDENRNLPKSCNCVQKYCMEKNIEDSRQNFFFVSGNKIQVINKFCIFSAKIQINQVFWNLAFLAQKLK